MARALVPARLERPGVRTTLTSHGYRLAAIGLCLLLFPILTHLGGRVVGAGGIWDFANALGFAALGGFLYLTLETGAPDPAQPTSNRFRLRLHTALALVTLGLVSLHIGVFLISDAIVVEYLKLSAPGYMLSGIAATLLVAILAITSFQPLRRRIYRGRGPFRFFHATLALVTLLLVAHHVLGSGFYTDTLAKQTLFLSAAVAAPILLIAGRRAFPRRIGLVGGHAPNSGTRTADRLALAAGLAALGIALAYALLRNPPA